MPDLRLCSPQRSVSLTKPVIHVICGGHSREAAVSLQSGTGVLTALRQAGYRAFLKDPRTATPSELVACDKAFIALHGPGGEDGVIQGFFETHNLPYTGSGVVACSITSDKCLTKSILATHKLPHPPCFEPAVFSELTGTVVIKPRTEGSSLGVHIIDATGTSVQDTYAQVLATYGSAFVEAYIPGQELTVGIITINQDLVVLPILSIRPRHSDFYNYETKYTPGASEITVPAALPESVSRACQSVALAAFRATQCRGFARIDIRLSADNTPYIIEINTIPGLTPTSHLPAQAAAYGLSYSDLIQAMLAS